MFPCLFRVTRWGCSELELPSWGDGMGICSVEINEIHPYENKQRLFIELAITRKAATITCIWQKLLEAVGGVGKRYGEKKGSLQLYMIWLGDFGMGKLQAG